MKKKRNLILIVGIILVTCGIVLLITFGYKKVKNEIHKQILLRKSVVLEIPSIDIRVPVVEGIDGENLHIAAGHFNNTGTLGKGNYCIAGHNSTIYAEIFNDLSKVKIEDDIYLFDNDDNRTKYTYAVKYIQIIESSDTWILKDFGDNRITIITCTDDGKQRMAVIGLLKDS